MKARQGFIAIKRVLLKMSDTLHCAIVLLAQKYFSLREELYKMLQYKLDTKCLNCSLNYFHLKTKFHSRCY